MDIRKIKKLIDLIDETGVSEIEIKEGEQSLRITTFAPVNQQVTYHPPVPAPLVPNQAKAPFVDNTNQQGAPEAPVDDDIFDGHQVCSPMVGTVYLSPSPSSPLFASIGQHVNIGDTLCIVEAMKMFNEIESDKAGILRSCLIDNEQPVEYGQPLFIIE